MDASQKGYRIEDSGLDLSKSVGPKFRRRLSRNQTLVVGGKADQFELGSFRFQSVLLKKKTFRGSGPARKEKKELYQVESDEEEDLECKNRNFGRLGAPGNESLLQRRKRSVHKKKLKLMKQLSQSANGSLLDSGDQSRLGGSEPSGPKQNAEGSRALHSRRTSVLRPTASVQVESQNSILRNTVLRRLVERYCRKSVTRQPPKESVRSSAKRSKLVESLLCKIEELKAENRDLADRNLRLEESQRLAQERLLLVARRLDGLR